MIYRASLKWMVWFIAAIGLVFLPQVDSAEAAGINKIVTVSSTAIKSNPYSYGKKLGILREGAKVKVYYQTKTGWSEIRYQGKKAYVLSRHLHTSYTWKPDNIYVYQWSPSSGENYGYAYVHLEDYEDGWKLWQEYQQDGDDAVEGYQYYIKEDRYGSHMYNPDTDETVTDLAYPVKTGKKWKVKVEGKSYYQTITSVTKTIKTPAGTFRNVVAVKYGNNYMLYYAPNVGHILTTYKGKRTYQLVHIENQ